MHFFILAWCLFMVVPSLAAADWQYTRWGMTYDEVVTAAHGVAKPDPESRAHSPEDQVSLLVAPYTAGRFVFTARFLFHRQTSLLSRIDLKLEDPGECASLLHELSGKYGEPLFKNADISRWRDDAANNSIVISRIGDLSCTVYYQALRSKDNKGL